jgi:predicted transcriptional regulator
LLRFTSHKQDPATLIPKFIETIRDVKKDKTFSLREIARKA